MNQISKSLFEKEYRNIERIKDGLIEMNYAKGNPKEGFLYRGTFFTNIPIVQQKDAPKKMLHPDLYDEGEYLNDLIETIGKEKLKVIQGLHLIFSPCETDQDIRDAAPEIIADLLPSPYRELPRTREEGYHVRGKILQLTQHESVVELLTFYVANRMLY